MSHCIEEEQEESFVATSVNEGDTHNSSSYTESSIKKGRDWGLWLLCHSHLLIISIHYHTRC